MTLAICGNLKTLIVVEHVKILDHHVVRKRTSRDDIKKNHFPWGNFIFTCILPSLRRTVKVTISPTFLSLIILLRSS